MVTDLDRAFAQLELDFVLHFQREHNQLSPLALVEEALPPRLRGTLQLELHSDPYMIAPRLVLIKGDETFECTVAFVRRDREWVRCEIPDWFMAHLCTA